MLAKIQWARLVRGSVQPSISPITLSEAPVARAEGATLMVRFWADSLHAKSFVALSGAGYREAGLLFHGQILEWRNR